MTGFYVLKPLSFQYELINIFWNSVSNVQLSRSWNVMAVAEMMQLSGNQIILWKRMFCNSGQLLNLVHKVL